MPEHRNGDADGAHLHAGLLRPAVMQKDHRCHEQTGDGQPCPAKPVKRKIQGSFAGGLWVRGGRVGTVEVLEEKGEDYLVIFKIFNIYDLFYVFFIFFI